MCLNRPLREGWKDRSCRGGRGKKTFGGTVEEDALRRDPRVEGGERGDSERAEQKGAEQDIKKIDCKSSSAAGK